MKPAIDVLVAKIRDLQRRADGDVPQGIYARDRNRIDADDVVEALLRMSATIGGSSSSICEACDGHVSSVAECTECRLALCSDCFGDGLICDGCDSDEEARP